MFSVGISTCVSQKAVTALSVPGITSLPPLMITIGLFICIVSTFGGFGSYFYKRSFLIIVTLTFTNPQLSPPFFFSLSLLFSLY